MGIETMGEVKKEKDKESSLERKEQEVMEKVKAIFRENAELNKLLLSEGDLNLSDHQKRYLTGQLTGFRREAKGVLQKLRSAAPKQAANGHRKRNVA
jgi:hypothetical protein